jgi:hypothetical protein
MTTARHWTVFWTSWFQSRISHPMYIRSILIPSSYQLVGFKWFFSLVIPTKILYVFSSLNVWYINYPSHNTRPANTYFFICAANLALQEWHVKVKKRSTCSHMFPIKLWLLLLPRQAATVDIKWEICGPEMRNKLPPEHGKARRNKSRGPLKFRPHSSTTVM